MNGHFEKAAVAIFVAMVMDGLDGRVARLTNTQTAFGAEYDSLSDMVAFGLAPRSSCTSGRCSTLASSGWLAAFVYTTAAALRLARFNTQVGIADKRYFQGLPSPSAAAIVAGGVWFAVEHELAGVDLAIPAGLLTVVVGLLMVSNIRYPASSRWTSAARCRSSLSWSSHSRPRSCCRSRRPSCSWASSSTPFPARR